MLERRDRFYEGGDHVRSLYRPEASISCDDAQAGLGGSTEETKIMNAERLCLGG